ncbi:MAG: hypothetical protein GWP91_04270 [Rhodobacterales bacterium]|nr:hypothetical protein [Rhodobacterales bacterium]
MRFSSLLLMASLWASPALAQTEVLPPPVPTADFTTYDSAMQSGKKADAANALLNIIDDPAQAALHGQAWVNMAQVMEAYSLDVAAVHAWSMAAKTDILVASPHLSHAIDLAEKTGDVSEIAGVFAVDLGASVDANTRSRMAYIAARELTRQDELGAALGLLLMVDGNSPVFADAESLRGVLLSMQGKHTDAIAPMLTAQTVARAQDRGQRFDNRIILNVARTYYGAENWAQAIYWFDQIERESEYWPEASFERAWAHFRADDMTSSISELMNHDSPFFEEWYFPEADLLRAYGMFMMCKFTDASASMDDFVATYTPLKAQLDGMMGSYSAEDGWADGVAMVNGTEPRVPKMVLRSFAREDRFAQSMQAVASADAEQARLPALSGAIAERAKRWVESRRNSIIQAEGGRVVAKGRYAQKDLKQMLEGIELTRLDLLNLEAEMYERASATGKLDFGDRVGKLRDMRKRKKNAQVWPFEGEYWADELGWYQLDARPDCPATMSAGE